MAVCARSREAHPTPCAGTSWRSAYRSPAALGNSGGRAPVFWSRPAWRALCMRASFACIRLLTGTTARASLRSRLPYGRWGIPAVEFAQDADLADHDDAVASALFSRDGDIEPFAQLLATRIERARGSVALDTLRAWKMACLARMGSVMLLRSRAGIDSWTQPPLPSASWLRVRCCSPRAHGARLR